MQRESKKTGFLSRDKHSSTRLSLSLTLSSKQESKPQKSRTKTPPQPLQTNPSLIQLWILTSSSKVSHKLSLLSSVVQLVNPRSPGAHTHPLETQWLRLWQSQSHTQHHHYRVQIYCQPKVRDHSSLNLIFVSDKISDCFLSRERENQLIPILLLYCP